MPKIDRNNVKRGKLREDIFPSISKTLYIFRDIIFTFYYIYVLNMGRNFLVDLHIKRVTCG